MSELQDIVLGNRYSLIEKIGEGGMALVYKAKDQLLNRYVAVKILRPEFTADEEFVNKFRRESLAAASLSHPNIVGIYDVGNQEGIYFIVMEYVCGITLKEYIKKNTRINYREALNIANQIANALDHAHKNGVVHRDIKPHNILVTEDKIIKVTDFGIARASNSSTIVNTGTVMGSVHYFSPEQAKGAFTDHRTDIYSLGVVLYEMLTGSLPYDADSPVTVALKHIQEDFIQPTIVVNTVPEAINDIVVKAMEKDMNKRYQTIKELIDDIEVARNNPYQKIERNQQVSQMTQKVPIDKIDKALSEANREKDKKKKKKSKLPWIISGIVAVVLISTVVGVIFFYNYMNVKEVTVPSIIGMNEIDAKTYLSNYKLRGIEFESIVSDKDKDVVIKVSPDVGTKVKENTIVKLTVSKGIENITVPDLSTKTEDDAKLAITTAKLTVGTVDYRNDDKVPKGQVIDQVPSALETAPVNSPVNITISNGPSVKMLTVPELVNETESQANNDLRNAGIYKVKKTYEKNDNFDDDVVIGQSLEAGSTITSNDILEITINKFNLPSKKVKKKINNNSVNSTGSGINIQ